MENFVLELIAASYIACADLRVVDGDTIKCDGQNMRLLGDGEPFVSGIDAPETSRAKCDQERKLGNEAKQRLSQLLKTPGIKIEDSGARDTTQQKRPLVRLRLPDGRFAETIMIQEGYAVVWTPGYKRMWCS
jgi:endonuclease YncB( thermonuclease family)